MMEMIDLIYTTKIDRMLYMDTTIEIIELRAFTSVVRQGSFTAAAVAMETDKAHVSRIVTRLEKKLSANLLTRSTRRLNVTEIGREFYERASGVLRALEDTQAAVNKAQSEPTGVLHITAGVEFGSLKVDDWVSSYLLKYSNVKIRTEYTNRVTDVIHEGIDIAIRIGPLPDSELSARKLGEIEYAFYASPSYLQDHDAPQDPDDLSNHDLVMFAPRGRASWKLVKDRENRLVEQTPRCLVSSNFTALNLAKDGIGVTLLPRVLAQDALSKGILVETLKGWSRAPVAVNAVFTSGRYMSPSVRAFIDLAVELF